MVYFHFNAGELQFTPCEKWVTVCIGRDVVVLFFIGVRYAVVFLIKWFEPCTQAWLSKVGASRSRANHSLICIFTFDRVLFLHVQTEEERFTIWLAFSPKQSWTTTLPALGREASTPFTIVNFEQSNSCTFFIAPLMEVFKHPAIFTATIEKGILDFFWWKLLS